MIETSMRSDLKRSFRQAFQRVRDAIRSGDYDKARKMLEGVMEENLQLEDAKLVQAERCLLESLINTRKGRPRQGLTAASQAFDVIMTTLETILAENDDTMDCFSSAEALGHVKLLVEILLAKSEALEQLGQHEESLSVLKLAKEKLEPLRSSNHHSLLKARLHYLEGTACWRQGRFDEALVILKLGIETTSELPDEIREDLLGQLYYRMGTVYQGKGNHQTALDYLERSLETFEKTENEQNVAMVLNNIGTVFLLKGEHDKALKHLEQSLILRRKIGNQQDIAISLNNIGLVYWNKMELDRALECFEQSLTIFKEITNLPSIASVLNNIGLIYQDKGDLDRALAFQMQGLELRKKFGNKHDIALSLNNIGFIYWEKGDLDRALECFEQSLMFWEELGNIQDISLVLSNLGRAYHEKGLLDRALEYYKESLALREEIGNLRDISYMLNNIGFVYREKGELDKALEYLERSASIFREIQDSRGLSISLYNIGRIYHDKGELDRALEQHQLSLTLKEKIGNLKHIAASLYDMGLIYREKGNITLALGHLQQSLAIREDIGNPEEIAESLLQLGIVYRENGDHDKAISSLKQSLELRQSIGNVLRLSETLFYLILALDDEHEHEKMQNYLKQLEKCALNDGNPIIRQRYRLCKALLLKHEPRVRAKLEAQQIFEDIAKEEVVNYELTSFALIHYCELLLIEYRVTNSEEIFMELNEIIENAEREARMKDMYPLLIETLLLKAKLDLLTMDIEQALEVLERARDTCETRGLYLLQRKVELERATLIEELKKWSLALRRSPEVLRQSVTETVQDLLIMSRSPGTRGGARASDIQALSDDEVKSFLTELRRRKRGHV